MHLVIVADDAIDLNHRGKHVGLGLRRAAGDDDARRGPLTLQAADRLARLRHGLVGHSATVDDDEIVKARAFRVAADDLGLEGIETAAEGDDVDGHYATLANSASVPAPDRLAASPVSSATPADVAASAPVVAATGAAPSIVNAKPAAADAVSKPSAPPKFLAANDLKAAFKTIVRDERQAWRELAPLWHLEPGNGEPCEAAQHHQVRCFKSASSLDFVRKLGRPGIVNLRDDSGHTVYALLTGLSAQTATLKMGEVTQTVSLVSFAKLWQGDFATYWRVPPGYGGSVVDGASGPIVEHLATQLASLAGEPAPTGKQTMNAALRTKVARFQSAHGIKAVGTAGPTTFMQLNRATGVDEPWLSVRTP